MLVFEVLRIRRYFLIALTTSLMFVTIYIYTQVLGIIENLDLWFTIIPWYNAVLFVVFAALFGIAVSFQVYTWKQPKVCRVNSKSIGTSSSATLIGLFVAQCPACASLGALLLPSSIFLAVFVKYSALINLVSIGLLLFTIRYLGGFRKAVQSRQTSAA